MVNSKARMLWRCLALTLAVGALALLMTNNHGQPAAAEGESIQVELPLRIDDDFESYPVSKPLASPPEYHFPDPPWKLSGWNGFTLNETFWGLPDDNQYLQLEGLRRLGQCGGSVAHRPIGGGGEIIIEGRIRNSNPHDDQPLTGCHKKFGGIELSAGPHWMYPHRGLIAFSDELRNPDTGARTIRGGAFELDEGPGIPLQDFNLNQWYTVRIHYKHTGANVQLTFTIDGVNRGSISLLAKSYEPHLRYVGLWAGEEFAWHDDVRVWAAQAPDPGDFFTEKVYLPLVVR
jgi:hypothetical protein